MKTSRGLKNNIVPLDIPCRKAMYNSIDEAKEAIDYILENKWVRDLSAYKCDICGKWHLTSK
jgi:hypothetical protein